MVADIWVCDFSSQSDKEIEDLGAWLSSEERACVASFRHPGARATFLVSRALIRLALSKRTGCAPDSFRFQTSPGGRPFVSKPEVAIDFNLTHTEGAACLIVTSGLPCGIDAECRERRVGIEPLARRCFSDSERAALDKFSGAERLTRFLEIWTLKEAYSKALGYGMAMPYRSFTWDIGGAQPRLEIGPNQPPISWKGHLLQRPRHIVAYCYLRGTSPWKIQTHDVRLTASEGMVAARGERAASTERNSSLP